MTTPTHINFKSINSRIYNDATTILRCVGKALDYQSKFYKMTTNYEIYMSSPLWGEKGRFFLQNFKIDVKKIDRLYYMKCYSSQDGSNKRHFVLICRMENNNNMIEIDRENEGEEESSSPIYVKLVASCDKFRGFNSNDNSIDGGNGEILVSMDVKHFMGHICTFNESNYKYSTNIIRKYLAKVDGIIIDKYGVNKENWTTHNDFKNFDLKPCYDAKSIRKYVGEALDYQDIFQKSVLPSEVNISPPLWRLKKLEDFVIDLEKIDRLYYVDQKIFDDVREFELIGRVKYDNSVPIFVRLLASCDSNRGFENGGKVDGGIGLIIVSKNADCFMDYISSKNVNNDYSMDIIRQSLARDNDNGMLFV